MKKILALCGPSGCGKTYLEKLLIDNSPISDIYFKKLEQVTTRKRREGEEGTYNFITVQEYRLIQKHLIAKTEIKTDDGVTNYYGTVPDVEDNDSVINTVIVNELGLLDLKNHFKDDKDALIKVIMIDSDSPEKRENRDEEFIKKERESLINQCDMYFLNHHSINEFVTIDDVFEALALMKMI